MTNEEQKLREFISKYVNDDNEPTFLSDLTALISEHYVSKEAFDEQKRIYFRLFDEEINCMYCEAKIRRGSAIILCKECAENTEV